VKVVRIEEHRYLAMAVVGEFCQCWQQVELVFAIQGRDRYAVEKIKRRDILSRNRANARSARSVSRKMSSRHIRLVCEGRPG
jgi:hypothetical protein